MTENRSLRIVRSRRASAVLVCKKCLKRIDDGRAFRKDLKSGIRRRSAELDIKRPRVVMTSCFDICPKHAVVVANGTMMHRGEVLLADNDSAQDAAKALLQRDQA